MTSVARYLPFLPFALSANPDVSHGQGESDGSAQSFEQLLKTVDLTSSVPLTASFSETGTLGFEQLQQCDATAQSTFAHHQIAATLPHSEQEYLTSASEAVATTAVVEALGLGRAGPSVAPQEAESSILPRARSHATSRTYVAPRMVSLAERPAANITDIAADSPQRSSSSQRSSLEESLSSLGAAISVRLERIDGTFRIHVRLPFLPDEERQRLIGRARDILEMSALGGAELFVHVLGSDPAEHLGSKELVHGY